MRSMTGYGRGQAQVSDVQVTVEVRSVNHRYLDIRTRFGGALSEYAAPAEDLVKPQLGRGRVELSGRLEGTLWGMPKLDMDRARNAFAALAQLRDELCPSQEVPLSLLAAVPDLFQARQTENPEFLRKAVLDATQLALQQLLAMRETEGSALHRDLTQRVTRIRAATKDLYQRAPEAVTEYRQQLRSRIAAILPEGLAVDQGRLEYEIALFADRSDVAEELTRLESHCEQLMMMLEGRQDAVGRRLDFLLQEMSREANTIGAKFSDVAATKAVVDLKAELERMREQAQNVL